MTTKTTPAQVTPLFVKISEAAGLMRYSERTVLRLIACGKLRAVGKGRGRRVVFASIAAFEQAEERDVAA